MSDDINIGIVEDNSPHPSNQQPDKLRGCPQCGNPRGNLIIRVDGDGVEHADCPQCGAKDLINRYQEAAVQASYEDADEREWFRRGYHGAMLATRHYHPDWDAKAVMESCDRIMIQAYQSDWISDARRGALLDQAHRTWFNLDGCNVTFTD